jgi:hypothetical protein
MIRHTIGKDSELTAVLACDRCREPIQDLDYAEVVWADRKTGEETDIIFGHTQCTRVFDDAFPNNMNAKEYLEKLK